MLEFVRILFYIVPVVSKTSVCYYLNPPAWLNKLILDLARNITHSTEISGGGTGKLCSAASLEAVNITSVQVGRGWTVQGDAQRAQRLACTCH